MSEVLELWTIYCRPSDYPDHYVARKCAVTAAGHKITGDMFVGDTLSEVRALLPPWLTRIPRYESDNPVIVEVWL